MSKDLITRGEDGESIVNGVTWPSLRGGKPTYFAFACTGAGASTVTAPSGGGISTRTNDYNGLFAVNTDDPDEPAHEVSAFNAATRVVTLATPWDTIPSASDAIVLFWARKFFLQNVGDEEVGLSPAGRIIGEGSGTPSGAGFYRFVLDTATRSCPFNVLAAVAPGSGVWTGTPKTVYGRLVAVHADGTRTTASPEIAVFLPDGISEITWTWAAYPVDPDHFEYWRTDVSGDYDDMLVDDAIPGSATQYVDTGMAPGVATFPTANTTGGPGPRYGVPPSIPAAGDLSIPGPLAPGQQVPYWMNEIVSAGQATATYRGRRRFVENLT